MRPMLRTIRLAFAALGATLICAPTVMVIAWFRPQARVITRLIRLWARIIVAGAGIELRTEHADRLDPARRYIIVANHHSYLDIPCMFASVDQPIRFLAKASLFKVPLFGWSIRATGFVPIDRKNRRTAVRSFELAGEQIRRGHTIVIFPEEGRSRELRMKEFQRGAFLLAIRSGLPIIPAAIDGTWEVMPATRLIVRPGPVTIRFGSPVETAGLTVRAKDELMIQTRETIESMLRKEGNPADV